MKYNMHGFVAHLLNCARKKKPGTANDLRYMNRTEAVEWLRETHHLTIHGGFLVFIKDSLGKNTFYCFYHEKEGEVTIPWNHVLMLIKASYPQFHGKKKEPISFINIKALVHKVMQT